MKQGDRVGIIADAGGVGDGGGDGGETERKRAVSLRLCRGYTYFSLL